MKEEIMKLAREILTKEKWDALYGDKWYTINVNDKEYIVEYNRVFFDDDRIGVLIYDENGNLKDMYYIESEVLK